MTAHLAETRGQYTVNQIWHVAKASLSAFRKSDLDFPLSRFSVSYCETLLGQTFPSPEIYYCLSGTTRPIVVLFLTFKARSHCQQIVQKHSWQTQPVTRVSPCPVT